MNRTYLIISVAALCALQAILPAGASNFALEIFGNANMDDAINEQDIRYVQGIINGTESRTKLADVNLDGKIDETDISQLRLIIDGKETEMTIVDCDGMNVTVHKPIKKIAVIADSTVEALRILNAKDRIVGIDEKTRKDVPTFLGDLMKLPSIGERTEPQVEKIIELHPDLVILGPRQWHGYDLEKKLNGTGIDVARLWLANSDVVLSEMFILGYLLDEKDRAEDYREWHDGIIDGIEEKVSSIPEEKRPSVFWDRPGKTTCGGNSSYQRTLSVAGGRNVAFDLAAYPEVDPEWVLLKDPDAVLGLSFNGGYESNNQTPLVTRYNEITGAAGFDSLRAVKDGKVFITHYIIHVNPGYPIGAAYLAKWLHPDLFSDLDPEAIHQEYLDRFQGIEFDVKKQGAFVYVP
jgi:iron complex transport system substrate-binding protein